MVCASDLRRIYYCSALRSLVWRETLNRDFYLSAAYGYFTMRPFFLHLKCRASWQRLACRSLQFVAAVLVFVRIVIGDSRKRILFSLSTYLKKKNQSPDTCEEYRWLSACRLDCKRTAPTAVPQLASSRTSMPSPTLQSVGYRGVNTPHNLARLRNRERRTIYLRQAWRNNRDYPRCSRDRRGNPYWLHPRMLRFQSVTVQKRNSTCWFFILCAFVRSKEIDLFYENKIADTCYKDNFILDWCE